MNEDEVADTGIQEAPAQVGASVAGTSTSTAEPAQEPPSWNGELAALDEQDWYKGLPDDIKPRVRAGHEAKLKTYDQGYQAKFRTLADERKSWETKYAEQQQALRDERAHIESLLFGEADPAAAVKADLEKKLAELQGKYDTLDKTVKERDEAANKQAADTVHDYIKAQAEDVYTDDEAFETVVGLIASGIAPDKALKMVRATMTVAEEPPKSVRAMGGDSGASNSQGTTPKTWNEAVKEELRRSSAH